VKKKLALIGGALAVCIAAYLLWTCQPWRTEPEEPPVPDAPVEDTAEPEPAYVSPIDFASLQERCPDIYAWLEIPDTDISYPVAQNADDTWYLTRDIDGNYSSDGTLFTESAYNGADLTDPATVIYGHRMNSGAMFGTLQKTYSPRASRPIGRSCSTCRIRRYTPRCSRRCPTTTGTFCITTTLTTSA